MMLATLLRTTERPAAALGLQAKRPLILRALALRLVGIGCLAPGVALMGPAIGKVDSQALFPVACLTTLFFWMLLPLAARSTWTLSLCALTTFGGWVVALAALGPSIQAILAYGAWLPWLAAEVAAFFLVALRQSRASKWAALAFPLAVVALTYVGSGPLAQANWGQWLPAHLAALFLFLHARYAEGVLGHRHSETQVFQACVSLFSEGLRLTWMWALDFFGVELQSGGRTT
jgi:hypothetical protein